MSHNGAKPYETVGEYPLWLAAASCPTTQGWQLLLFHVHFDFDKAWAPLRRNARIHNSRTLRCHKCGELIWPSGWNVFQFLLESFPIASGKAGFQHSEAERPAKHPWLPDNQMLTAQTKKSSISFSSRCVCKQRPGQPSRSPQKSICSWRTCSQTQSLATRRTWCCARRWGCWRLQNRTGYKGNVFALCAVVSHKTIRPWHSHKKNKVYIFISHI